MNSLYEINNELLNLFAQIEEQEGEITEEQESLLEITQDKLTDKLTDYKNAIQQWKSDIEAIKCEGKRLSDRKNVLTNRIDKLKEQMLFAVEKYGCEGKSNKYYELKDARIFTKSSPSVDIDEERITFMINCLISYIKESDYKNAENFLVYLNEKASILGIEPFIIADVDSITLEIKKDYTIKDLFNSNNGLLNDIHNEQRVESEYQISSITSKSEFGKKLQYIYDELTIAQIKYNNSIQIK